MVETSNEWIVDRTGIRQRHIVDKGVATSDLAIEASRNALQERGIPAAEIEAIFVGTVTPDMLFPATACIVQDKIGAKGAWGYDISAACSAFVYSLQTAVKFVESGAHKRVLAIGADVMTSIIIGDGAGAVLVEPATDDNYVIDFIHEVDGAGACSLFMPGGGSRNPTTHETVEKKMHYVHQDGQAVFKYAVRKMAEASETVLTRNGFKGSDVALFVPHQANKRIIMSAADRLGLEEDRIIINIDEFGNTTAGTIDRKSVV